MLGQVLFSLLCKHAEKTLGAVDGSRHVDDLKTTCSRITLNRSDANVTTVTETCLCPPFPAATDAALALDRAMS